MAENGEGTYVCNLDEKTLKKAKKELNEDPKQRASQIETFRQWVKAQPHIKSRTGMKRFLQMGGHSYLCLEKKKRFPFPDYYHQSQSRSIETSPKEYNKCTL